MLKIALTGNVASGKSTVVQLWRNRGVPVLIADEVARAVVEPGTPGLARVAEAFGEEVLNEDGSLDRAALRGRVFSDPESRSRLEGILHPLIEASRDRWIAEREADGQRIVVMEIPLLYEAGLEDGYDAVVLIDAPVESRLARMMRDRGLTEEEAIRIIRSQRSAEKKRENADFVIDNDGTLAELESKAEVLLEILRSERSWARPGSEG